MTSSSIDHKRWFRLQQPNRPIIPLAQQSPLLILSGYRSTLHGMHPAWLHARKRIYPNHISRDFLDFVFLEEKN